MEVFKAQKGLVKSWTEGVVFDEKAKQQVLNVADMPFIHKWVAVMPDVHVGKGATIGSVIPTKHAIIPAAVGVDIGCGMMATKTSLTANDLPDNLHNIRLAIEEAVPHGRTNHGLAGDKGAWKEIPRDVKGMWHGHLARTYDYISDRYPELRKANSVNHLGTLGTGNHFIELCLDQDNNVWVMLHSGSRGIGNKIGSLFIELAKRDMKKWFINVPDEDLAYLPEGTDHFVDYIAGVEWAQTFAHINRKIMLGNVIAALRKHLGTVNCIEETVTCHHTYVEKEHHYGENVWVTRKGAVRAREGELGIIPGSMGTGSFIVRGKGNQESFCSCSHGAGRVMSRREAKKLVSLDAHKEAVKGVECRLDADVIDETPSAYKDINAVMEAQKDLVDIVYQLKQVVCVKG